MKHVAKTFGPQLELRSLSAEHLQSYVNQRAVLPGRFGKTISTTTIKKELATLRSIWNWAIAHDSVTKPLSLRSLRYPKLDEKAPYRTIEEIEREIKIGKLPEQEQQELWHGLYPQSNGKIERYHRTIKSECIRPGTPLCLEDARRLVANYVTEYNEVRLHSELGYVTPIDKLHDREKAIFDERDRKLQEARERRASNRKLQDKNDRLTKPAAGCYTENAWAEDRATPARRGPERRPRARSEARCGRAGRVTPLPVIDNFVFGAMR